jgi:nucleoside-diphosphate-sugar epimerase
MNRPTVLLTGGTGLLGKQLLLQLVAKDYRVYAVKRTNSVIPIDSENISWIEIQSLEDDIFKQLPEKVDYVIHAAALVSYRKADKEKIFQINTKWTIKLAQLALNANVHKFIFISSISALGKTSASNFIDELTAKSEHDVLSNYGRSKRQAEERLCELSKKGLPIIIFNPSVIIGPAKRYQSSAQLFAYVSDQKPFYTKGLINYIDVRDVAAIISKSLENGIINERYILNTGSISYHDFFKTIANCLQVKAPTFGVPKFMVVLGAILENIVSKLRGNPATLTMETAKMAGNKNIYEAEKANLAFNYSYKTLEHSIEWTVSEMKKTGEL